MPNQERRADASVDLSSVAEPSSDHVATIGARVLRARVVPRATYRVQLHENFTFRDATAIVPYLDRLGVSHLYISPPFAAYPGSAHGYDVIDFGRLNPELGSRADFDRLAGTLRRRGMGLIVDFVPNHMGIGGGLNPRWLDVLEHGRTSDFADFFDIDWQPLKPELRGKVLLPVLADHYGSALERGDLQLDLSDGRFSLRYAGVRLPIAPPTYPQVLDRAVTSLAHVVGEQDPSLQELISLSSAFARLPTNDETSEEAIAERKREQLVGQRRLAALVAGSPAIEQALTAAVTMMNGDSARPESFDPLDALLLAQSYRLSFWRVAAEEINYRRFFAINELAAIRQEVPRVFAATHALLLELVADGLIDGIRIDHPDGLWNPAEYTRNLQEAVFVARCRSIWLAEQGARPFSSEVETAFRRLWRERNASESSSRGIYLVVEKIVEPGERLPLSWPVDGTVGYEFAQSCAGLFVDQRNERLMHEVYQRFTGVTERYGDIGYRNKMTIMRFALASEVNVLARSLDRITERHRRTRDFTLNSLRDALREIIACFPVYRTYRECGSGPMAAEQRRVIRAAITAAKRRNPALDASVFDFIGTVLLGHEDGSLDEETRAQHCAFVMKFQQLTGPVMAKGIEDTTFYVYNRLIALNEVGGDPAAFGVSPVEFHRRNVERMERWPHGMLTGSTHDTKRSEDARARLLAISEAPRLWRTSLTRWSRLHRRFLTRVDGAPAPDANDRYLLYQTLLALLPWDGTAPDADVVERLVAYMRKATKEAQRRTSWISPNDDYDRATESFVRAALTGPNLRPFQDDLQSIRQFVQRVGAIDGLAMQLLRLTSPGVPDIYQGTEAWDFSLVDPDNRRPVAFDRLNQELAIVRRGAPSVRSAVELLRTIDDGRAKLFVTATALGARRDDEALFRDGDYQPLESVGPYAAHIVAFQRRFQGRTAIVVAPRLVGRWFPGADDLAEAWRAIDWENTSLRLPTSAKGPWRDAFTGQTISVSAESADEPVLPITSVLGAFPIALLLQSDPSSNKEQSS